MPASRKEPSDRASGVAIIFVAAFVWGVGNAVTGLTAHKYLSAHSVLPGVDIALANTLGGLAFLALVSIYLRSSANPAQRAWRAGFRLPVARTLAAGAMKGANTCLFVLSATHIPATDALVLESAYVVFSLVLAAVATRLRASLWMWGEAGLLLVGVLLVEGLAETGGSGVNFAGVAFGLGAGFTYALFLFAWSAATTHLEHIRAQVAATLVLLSVALVTLVVGGEIIGLAQTGAPWTPFAALRRQDVAIQMVNGAFVVGLVYLLVTIGLQRFQRAEGGASALTSLGLAFSVPFTLLPEVVAGRISPSLSQLCGIGVFMAAFVILNTSVAHRNDVRP
jgi:drug/metabolite transporter (DMT)-like permease